MNVVKAIENSVLDLINTQRLDSLTIEEICSHADVGKTTFYRYFKDKYDLINHLFDKIMPEGSADVGRTISWSEELNLVFDRMGIHRNFLRQAYISDDFNNLQSHSEAFFTRLILNCIKWKNGNPNDESLSFSASLYAKALSGYLKTWVQNGGFDTKENLVQMLIEASPFNLYKYLQ